MQVKIQKADGSVVINDVTEVTILATEGDCLTLQDGRIFVRLSPPLTFTDIVTLHRTSKYPVG